MSVNIREIKNVKVMFMSDKNAVKKLEELGKKMIREVDKEESPTFETPLRNVYLANIEQVYPWDRGTNYAVELGEKVTDYLSRK